jgi:Ca2+-binding EF-hand superfamily protein
MRVVDIHNEKLFRIRFDDQEDVTAIQNRLGFATFFPFIQPEQAKFAFNFANNDERFAAHFIFTLMQKENLGNVIDFSYTLADGTKDNLTTGIPRFWWALKTIPTQGVFRCEYVCAPDERDFATRKMLLQSFGSWSIPDVEEDDVHWRMGLHEAPADVLEFVEFVVGRSLDFLDVYRKFDGPRGNGQITLREMEEGYKRLLAKPELSTKDKEVITAVFRYLDRSGEGEVSIGEWSVLGYLYDEINMCIFEFVQFCERTFGPDLADTWAYLDDDGSGAITAEEWEAAVHGVGFFGPTMPIFNFLDKDDEGTLSLDEFAALEEFASKKPTRQPSKASLKP